MGSMTAERGQRPWSGGQQGASLSGEDHRELRKQWPRTLGRWPRETGWTPPPVRDTWWKVGLKNGRSVGELVEGRFEEWPQRRRA
jgi:hypothetical protein